MKTKVPLRTTLKAGWPAFAFVIGALFLLIVCAPYTQAIPMVLVLWVVAFIVFYKIGKRIFKRP